MILSSILTLLKINSNYLELFMEQFITAVENMKFEIYLRFIGTKTYRVFYFSRRLFVSEIPHFKFLVSDF